MSSGCSKRDLERIYRRAKNAKTISPCQFCRANKLKCNDFRPCTRCIRNHLSDLCTLRPASIGTEDSGAAGPRGQLITPSIERPIAFQTFQIDFGQRNPLENVFLKHHWTCAPLRRLYNTGYHAGTLAQIADSLPTDFDLAILGAVKAVQAAIHTATNETAYFGGQPFRTLAPSDSSGLLDTDRLAGEDELLWEIDSNVGFNRVSFEPVTQVRRSAAVNSCFATNVSGIHR